MPSPNLHFYFSDWKQCERRRSIPLDQEHHLQALILEVSGISVCVVWSSSRRMGKPQRIFMGYNRGGGGEGPRGRLGGGTGKRRRRVAAAGPAVLSLQVGFLVGARLSVDYTYVVDGWAP